MKTDKQIEELVESLWSLNQLKENKEDLYCVLDGAQDKAIFSKIKELKVLYCCLYSGNLSNELAETAPYLIQLQKEGAFIRWLIKEGWGTNWGVFLSSASGLNDLRKHFRQYLMVKTEEGKSIYFRYYDPRVLRVYIPTCNDEELNFVFGPVTCFITESEIINKYMIFDFSKKKLQQSAELLFINNE